MFAASLATAALDTVLPLFIGRLVSLMEATDRVAALEEQWPLLAAMVFLVLVARPLVAWVDISIRHMVLIPGATCLIRWQSHWHVVRQSWPFFQNDFAGRIANRVMQTAHALRDSVMASIRAVWYIGAYGVIACTLMATADWRLGLPTLGWFAGYIALLWYFVPRMRDLARTSSEARSLVMARVVDSYTNILTVKLFARLADEDAYVPHCVRFFSTNCRSRKFLKASWNSCWASICVRYPVLGMSGIRAMFQNQPICSPGFRSMRPCTSRPARMAAMDSSSPALSRSNSAMASLYCASDWPYAPSSASA